MRTSVRLAPLVALAFAVVGCGGTPKLCLRHGIKCENLPQHKVYKVNWVEHARVAGKPIAVFRVTRVEVGPDGWKIDASFANQSPETFTFPRGGPNSPNDFGLGVFTTPLPQRIEEAGNYLLGAATIEPPMPHELRPGESWTGTLSSAVAPRTPRWLRILFGVFFWKGKPPYNAQLLPYFLWQTTHSLKTPPPAGANP